MKNNTVGKIFMVLLAIICNVMIKLIPNKEAEKTGVSLVTAGRKTGFALPGGGGG